MSHERRPNRIGLSGVDCSPLSVFLFLLTLFVSTAGQSADDSIGVDQFEGKKIASVTVVQAYPPETEKVISDDELKQVVLRNTSTLSEDLSARFPIHPETAKSSVEDYFASAGFLHSSANVTGTLLESDEVAITVKVNSGSRSQVTGIVFTGDFNFPESELRKELTECIGTNKNYFDKRHYEYCLGKGVRDLFFADGYFKTKIGDPRMLSHPNGVVEIPVSQGPQYLFRRLEIQGAVEFGNENVREFLNLTKGLPPNGRKLRDKLEKELKEIYENLGFLEYQAAIDPEFVDPENEDGPGIVDLKVTIDEGSRYRLAGISFVSADSKTALMMRSLIGLKDGEYFSRKLLREGIEKINALGEFWEIDLDQDSEFRPNPETRELFIKIKIARRDD